MKTKARPVKPGLMLALIHVMLHVGLCAPIAKLAPETTVALNVRLTDRTGRIALQRQFRVERGDEDQSVVEFDNAFGTYRLDVNAPKFGCSTNDFLYFLSDGTRSITEQLGMTAPEPAIPVLVSGEAPQSMLYANPTFVMFDKSAATCGKPIPAPLTTSHVTVENDGDSYYASLFNDDPSRAPDSEMLALRLQTSTHQHHYIRLSFPYPQPRYTWPTVILLNVSGDMMDALATDPVDTLLCPKMWRTSVG